MPEPRDYDREFVTPQSGPVRLREGISTEHGTVTRFVVHLQYMLDGEWTPVVRLDHDPASEQAHDVTTDGVHVDIYRDGEKVRVVHVCGPLKASIALSHAEDHIQEHGERYVERFEQWHGIRTP